MEIGNWMVLIFSGCDCMLGFVWGYYVGVFVFISFVIRFIIDKVGKVDIENKLNIICFGFFINVVVVIVVVLEIVGNLRVYLLGVRYDLRSKVWDKNEFNICNDFNVFDFLFNIVELEFWVMLANIV